jgi:hypothetical protein
LTSFDRLKEQGVSGVLMRSRRHLVAAPSIRPRIKNRREYMAAGHAVMDELDVGAQLTT